MKEKLKQLLATIVSIRESVERKDSTPRTPVQIHGLGTISALGWCEQWIAKIDASIEGDGWQPFETAPMDRSEFLAYRGDRVFVMYWMPEDKCWQTAYGDLIGDTPTHWMPFPAGPVSDADAKPKPKNPKSSESAFVVVIDALSSSQCDGQWGRLRSLVKRLCASGPKAAHVSASECHEICDDTIDALDQLERLTVANSPAPTAILVMVRDALKSTHDALRRTPMISSANPTRRAARRLAQRARREGVQLAIDQVELMITETVNQGAT